MAPVPPGRFDGIGFLSAIYCGPQEPCMHLSRLWREASAWPCQKMQLLASQGIP